MKTGLPTKLETYKTISLLALAFLVAYSVSRLEIFILVSGLLLLICFVFMRLAQLIAYGWLEFAKKLGQVNSVIILSVIFTFMFTPLSVIYRIFHQKEVARFRKNDKDSYFEAPREAVNKVSFTRQW